MSILESDNNWRKALITLSQFVFLGEREFIRENLYQNAIEIILFLNGKRLTFSEIQKSLVEDLIGINLPLEIIEKTGYSLSETNNVIIEQGLVKLSPERRATIQNKVNKSNSQKRDILDFFVNLLVKEYRLKANLALTANDQNLCTTLFWKYLSKFVNLELTKLTKLWLSSKSEFEFSTPRSLFVGLEGDIEKVELREAFKNCFEYLFKNKVEVFLKFLHKSYMVLTCWQLLRLNTSIKLLKKNEFSNKHIILDTNCLMSLLCKNAYAHQSVSELVQLTRKLNVKIHVTEKTITEYRKVLDGSNERMALLNIPNRVMKRVHDEFISSYAYEVDSDPELTWKDYYSRMSNPKDFLETDFGVEVVSISKHDFIGQEVYSKVIDEVSKAWKEVRGVPKHYEIAEHDAFHLLMVKKLREEDKKKKILGPNYWFLTRDSSLYLVNPFIDSLEIFKSKISPTISITLWLNFITPFLSPNEEEGYLAFAEVLKTAFTHVPIGISSRILIEVQGEWTKYEWLSTEDIEDILKDTVIQTLASKLSKLEEQGADATSTLAELRQQFDTIISQKFNETMELIQKQMKKSNDKIDQLTLAIENKDKTIGDLTDEIKRDMTFKLVWQCVSGILGAILVFSSLYVYFTNSNPSIQTTLVSCLAIIAGIVFILMAIAYEQVKAQISVAFKNK